MEIQTLTCNCCGAPLVALDVEGLYACRHCDALHATSDAGTAIFGRKLDEIHQATRQIAERLERIELGRRRDERHFPASRRPVVRRCDLNAAVLFGVVFCSFGILLCLVGLSASAGVFVAGLGCIVTGVVGAIIIDNKTVSNERWQELITRYQKRPQWPGIVDGRRLL